MIHLTLSGSISRKRAIVAVAIPIAQTLYVTAQHKKLARVAKEMVDDRDQRIHICLETIDFLTERADDRTIVELNEKLDYWRVVREMPIPCDCPAHDYRGRECTCTCDHTKDEN